MSILAAPALVALVSLSGTAMAHPGHPHTGATATHKVAHAAALVCPVTGTKIASKAKAVGHSTYKGKTYYFCCPDCKPKFDKDPAKYVRNAAKGKYEKM